MKASLPYKYITAVKNGKQYVVFDYKDIEGKRKRKWINTGLPEKCTKKSLKATVNEKLTEFDKSIAEGKIMLYESRFTLVKSDDENVCNQPLGDFFNEWLAYIKPNSARTTHMCYGRIVVRYMNYANEHFPNLTLGEVTHNHIQAFLSYKHDNGIKGSTVKQYYLALHSAFAFAVKMELIQKHPMDKLVVPRAERPEASFYNSDELNELFEAFHGDKLELVVNIAAYYGLRRCEILGLKWEAIDFKNKTITIQRKVVTAYDETGKLKLYVENRLKTNSSRRTLPLIPHIEQMLLEKKKLEAHFRKECGESYDHEFDGFICRDNYGKMISPNYVTGHFHYIITKQNMKQLRFHDLRHSCASLLLAHDIPMKAIQEWLGHSNFAITANLYSHLEYNAKINSAETIAKVLGGKSESEESASESSKITAKKTPRKTSGRKKKDDSPTV